MKEPIVTRTCKSFIVDYLAVDLASHAVGSYTQDVPAYFKEKDKIFKYLISLYEEAVSLGLDVPKPVEIIDVRRVEELRGMTERTFIENSYVIDSKKKNDTQE